MFTSKLEILLFLLVHSNIPFSNMVWTQENQQFVYCHRPSECSSKIECPLLKRQLQPRLLREDQSVFSTTALYRTKHTRTITLGKIHFRFDLEAVDEKPFRGHPPQIPIYFYFSLFIVLVVSCYNMNTSRTSRKRPRKR